MDKRGTDLDKKPAKGRMSLLVRGLLASVIILSFMSILAFLYVLDRLDVPFYNKLLCNPLKNVSDDIVILAVDDYPQDHAKVYRERHGEMIKRLVDAKAKVIGFDFLFEENTESDNILSDGLKYAKEKGIRVILVAGYNEKEGKYNDPESAFKDNASDIGIADAIKETNNETIRCVELAMPDKRYHLALLMLADSKKINESNGKFPINSKEQDYNGTFYLRFVSPEKFASYRYLNVMNMPLERLMEIVSGKYVLIGTTAPEWNDSDYKTPIGRMAGVFVVANVLNNLIEGKLVRPINEGWTILGLFFSSIVVWGVLQIRWLKNIWLWGFMIILVVAYILFDRMLFANGHYMPVIYVPVNMLASVVVIQRLKKKTRYDAFISYRREGGSDVADRISESLVKKGKRVFIDRKEMQSGEFDIQLLKHIAESPNFIVVLKPGSLDRCQNTDDWVRKEISEAIRLKKNIIPIFVDDFKFPDQSQLPDDLNPLPRYHGIAYNRDYFDAFIINLLGLMR